ncbi:hypothetical protein OIU77_003503 [Salix suchowensis]|uniref:Uncharacterized protein n=1 Tax=Salix suchowensis TaxID=1278906 RepID=A0ABQ9AZX3_9ROSI|nr:hypothetical protein OIU77_003503 [Salix suchowensis]
MSIPFSASFTKAVTSLLPILAETGHQSHCSPLVITVYSQNTDINAFGHECMIW